MVDRFIYVQYLIHIKVLQDLRKKGEGEIAAFLDSNHVIESFINLR